MDTVLLLHGFAGSAASWDAFGNSIDRERYRPLAIDLRGHGQNAALRPISFELCVEDLLAAAPPRFTLAGYSLGGRIALQLALAAPERVERLVLISTTAGIDDDAVRSERLDADLALADRIETDSIDRFAEDWLAGPLFSDDPPEVNAAARRAIERNQPVDLASALRALSVGRMAPLWDRLDEIATPTTVVAGELDPRYVALAERLGSAIKESEVVIVPSAGHALPRIAPDALAKLF